MQSPHRAFVAALGGPTKLAKTLGVPFQRVSKWWIPGGRIPPVYWPKIARLPAAVKAGITVDLLEATAEWAPPKTQHARTEPIGPGEDRV